MSLLDTLQQYWLSKIPNTGQAFSSREPDEDEITHLYENDEEQLEKGKRGKLYWNDPYAMATAVAQRAHGYEEGDRRESGEAPPWGRGDFARGGEGASVRDKIAAAIKREKGKGKKKGVNKMLLKDKPVDMEKLSPGLEQLIAFGAGWALSGDLVNKDVPANLVREWERAVQNQADDNERRKLERKIRSKLRKSDDSPLEALNAHFVEKDHAPVPPRVGLMWDAVKHRWTRPERIGRTVWELSGHKRIRGTGTGVHERSTKTGGSGGRGAGSATAGRRFRSTGDAGKLNVHDGGKKIGSKGEQKHPALRGLKAFRKNPEGQKKKKKKE